MRQLVFLLACTSAAVVTAAFIGSLGSIVACDLDAGSGDAGDGGPTACGTTTCTATQVCLYRNCSSSDRCQVSATCPDGTTPATCDGQPGCLLPESSCPPVVQGCRDIPSTCGGDPTCACNSICGSVQLCGGVSGASVTCNSP